MTDQGKFYQADLAYVHDAGFGDVANHAAEVLLDELRKSGHSSGTVVDLGCGSGILARTMFDADYAVVGFDLSGAMVKLAQERVPEGDFRAGSFVSAEIPNCVAVTATGEVLNYTADERNNAKARTDLFQKVHAALAPGGRFLFDIAGSAREPTSGRARGFREGKGWTVLWEKDVDEERRVLTRRITTFRLAGEGYRRSVEVHVQELIEPDEVVAALSNSGFETETLSHYGVLDLPVGLVGFLARKPAT